MNNTIKFYIDTEKKIIDSNLLDTQAKRQVNNFINDKPQLTPTQLRKYFHEVKAISERLKEEDFDRVKPLIVMLKVKAAYDCPKTKRGKKIPPSFKNFIFNCVNSIRDKKDFEAFALFMEAILGYFYEQKGRS